MASPSPLQSAPQSGSTPTVLLRVKIVPGASRNRVAGLLGDRLKIQVAAPPEGGKANAMVCALLAELFDLSPRQVLVVDGPTRPLKTIAITGIDLAQAQTRLAPWLTKS